ncbi:MAG: HAD family hydrolase [Chloroflexi bacterium]|nr:MAG: HAD family hydrolase [Chloroflexota bacterium]TMD70799.1 MAG: HAD family hydrolase [Chloroflexota bacterium]
MTFDCFGTLIDWRHGIRTTGELLFPGRGQNFLDTYIALEAEVESEGSFKRYRAVLTETTRRAAKRLSVELKPDDATALVSTIPYWPPFADVGPALGDLRKQGWRFALLTNCDRDIIALTQRRLPASFDAVVTAEDVSAYKPSPAHFRLFQSTFASSASAWIHVAQSYFHDIIPTHELGITRIWVNRQGEKDDPSLADSVIGGLAELPDAVLGLSKVG